MWRLVLFVIEAFFKVCKTYLKLSKESRSPFYDAMTAHVTVELIIMEFAKQIEYADIMESDKMAAMAADFMASLPNRIKQVNSVCESEISVDA